MKKTTILLLFSALVIMSGCATNGTDYFVSQDGDDGASGTSHRQAWKSIEMVNATDLNPGDRILFRAGETF